jgi:hypothetical protein
MVEECEQEGAEGAGGEQGGGAGMVSCKDGCGQKAGEAEGEGGSENAGAGLGPGFPVFDGVAVEPG